MAVVESDHRAFDAKSQLDAPSHVDIDLGSPGSALQNGHSTKQIYETSSTFNTSAHQTNSDIASHDFAPSTNGVAHPENHQSSVAQSAVEPTSSFTTSIETDNSQPPLSSQSAPDSLGDSTLEASPSAPPASLQQPTPESRAETQIVDIETTSEIKVGVEGSESRQGSEMANGVIPGSSQPPTLDAKPEPQSDPLSPQPQISADQPDPIPTADLPNHPPVPLPDGGTVEAPIDPAPSPAPLEDTSTATAPKQEGSDDHIMEDAPRSPAKVSREREDDEIGDGPAAKRSKTEDDASTDFKVPERPAINTQLNGLQDGGNDKGSQPMTSLQHKALSRAMQNVKRVQAAAPFRLPVDFEALKIPSYPTIITKPMDLRTLEENLKAGNYPNVDAFVTDFNQIVENCRTFNGPDHTVTKLAYDMKNSFEKQMEKVPGPDAIEPSPADKKKKTGLPPIPKASAPRRESRSSLPGAARSPVSAVSTPTSAQTFALGPQGVPLIRRDSTLGDGRPKREIHPPAPRDLPYSNQKPKKKKFQYELKFCEKVLAELAKPKYVNHMAPFITPVDPVALNIPNYHSIIKKPMDFGTMKEKLDHGEYENAKEFEADARQVFQNCYKFNKPVDYVHITGKELERIFDSEWAKKRDWIEANAPSSGAQSPGSSEAEDSDEEVEEEVEEEDEDMSQLSKLQQQIAQMSRQVELISQKKKSPPVSNKKVVKGAKPVKKESKKATIPVKVEKKPSKPAKKTPYVTYEQKQDISNRINNLSEAKMATALSIIRNSMPNLKDIQDDELELDIDELSDEVLHKLLIFVRKHVPRPEDAPARPPPSASTAAPTRKKNKPMSKTEQEARIAQVQNGLSAFQNPGSTPVYDDPGPDQESSDGGESSESEEE